MIKNNLDYNFTLSNFEGPLDLLIHLIKNKKKDILNINVLELTNQYLEFVENNINNDLEVASEYLVMASYLIELKTKTLLPERKISEINDNFEIDERSNLISKLLEYEEYKMASKKMEELELDRRRSLDKENNDLPEVNKIIKEVFDISSLDEKKIYLAMNKMIERIKMERPIESKINIKRISVSERMDQIIEYFKNSKTKVIDFVELFDKTYNSYIAITLLTILEMSRNGIIEISQNKLFDKIYLKWKA